MMNRLLLPGPFVVRLALWLAFAAAFPLPPGTAAISFQLEVLGRVTTVNALPPRSVETLGRTEGVLSYLEKAETKETDPWYRDDLRIAWITTLYAARGNCQAHIDATYRVLGCHPEEVWPRIVARRKTALGPLYELWGFDLPPKKPPMAVSASEYRLWKANGARAGNSRAA